MADIVDRHELAASDDRTAPDLFRLEGRVAVVTGGAGKVGVPISTGLAEAGAHVIVAARDLDRSEELCAKLRGRGLEASALQCDLRDAESVRALRDSVVERHGRVDVLVNNAASRHGTTLEKTTPEEWNASMEANGTALLLASKLFAEPMVEQRRGVILNIASIVAVVAPDFRIYAGTDKTSPIDYTFAKGGMVALTRYLAAYLAAHNVRVNAISPGGYYSGKQTAAFLEAYSERVPLGRMVVDADLKGAVVFLASDASAHITGHNLVLDGGLTVW